MQDNFTDRNEQVERKVKQVTNVTNVNFPNSPKILFKLPNVR